MLAYACAECAHARLGASYLVLMTGTLAVFGEAFHSLVDESHILLIDVESKQAQTSGGAAANTVQELKCLANQVVVVLVILTA